MIERIVVGPLHTNCYVIATGKRECLIIDPGAEEERILERLELLNLRPWRIIATHGHIDHVSAAASIQAQFATPERSIPLAVHGDDSRLFDPEHEPWARAVFEPFGDPGLRAFATMYGKLREPDELLSAGMTIGETDFTVLHTPGHTPGSICLYSESLQAVFTGDTLFFGAIGRGDLRGGNQEQLEQSVQSQLFRLPPETRLFPGHGPYSVMERESAQSELSTDHTMI